MSASWLILTRRFVVPIGGLAAQVVVLVQLCIEKAVPNWVVGVGCVPIVAQVLEILLPFFEPARCSTVVTTNLHSACKNGIVLDNGKYLKGPNGMSDSDEAQFRITLFRIRPVGAKREKALVPRERVGRGASGKSKAYFYEDEAIAGRCWKKRVTVCCWDCENPGEKANSLPVDNDEKWSEATRLPPRLKGKIRQRARHLICTPLKADSGQVIGVLSLDIFEVIDDKASRDLAQQALETIAVGIIALVHGQEENN